MWTQHVRRRAFCIWKKKYVCPQKMWFLFVSQLTGMPEVGHLVFVKSAAYDVYKCVLGLWQALSPNESDGDWISEQGEILYI